MGRRWDLTYSTRAGLELANVLIMVVAAISKFLVSHRRVDGGRRNEVTGDLEFGD